MFLFFICLFLLSCKQNKIPDVSSVKIDVNVKRFEQDFFSSDTSNLNLSFQKIQAKYPSFFGDYLSNVLGITEPDSIPKIAVDFYRNYFSVYQATKQKFTDLSNVVKDVKYSFQLTKHYFPKYELPKNLITFVGPVEGYASVLTREGVAVGLQQYLGKDFSLYQTEYVREIYPAYQVRRFESPYISVNIMKNIIDEMYPPAQKRLPLIEIMIEQGKRLQLLKYLMPVTADTLLTGYSADQLEGCYENEGLIWNFFIQNDLLYQSDPFLIRDYINDGPKTAPLGESSPGNIGQFVGWQIVKKYLEKNEATPEQLMNTPAKQIFTEAKYKPK